MAEVSALGEPEMPGSSVLRRTVAHAATDARLVVHMWIDLHDTRTTDRSIGPDACAVKRKHSAQLAAKRWNALVH